MPGSPDTRATRPVRRCAKRIEEAFGWIKTVGGLANTKLTGQALLCFVTYNWGSALGQSAAGGTPIMREPGGYVRPKWAQWPGKGPK